MPDNHTPGNHGLNYNPTMEFRGFGRAYVPHQRLCGLFSAKEGFIRGTIFPELYIPYEPDGRGGGPNA